MTNIIESIIQKVRDEVFDAWDVISFDDAYAKYPKEEVQRFIASVEEDVKDAVARLGLAGLISVASEGEFWNEAMTYILDRDDHGLTVEDVYRLVLEEYIIERLDLDRED